VRYDQNNNAKNHSSKKGSAVRLIAKFTSNGDPKSLSELTNALSSKNLTTFPFESPKSVERGESYEGLKFWKICCCFSAFIAENLQFPKN